MVKILSLHRNVKWIYNILCTITYNVTRLCHLNPNLHHSSDWFGRIAQYFKASTCSAPTLSGSIGVIPSANAAMPSRPSFEHITSQLRVAGHKVPPSIGWLLFITIVRLSTKPEFKHLLVGRLFTRTNCHGRVDSMRERKGLKNIIWVTRGLSRVSTRNSYMRTCFMEQNYKK